MREFEFRNYLKMQNHTKKVISDIVSRLKKIENDFVISIDSQIQNDKGINLLNLLKQQSHISHINTYRYSLNKYINFINDKKK